MTEDSACSWSTEIQLSSGVYLFKFVTGGSLTYASGDNVETCDSN